MPSLDHLLQPEQDFVSLLTHRIHSVLGSAWYSLRQPLWMPQFEAAPQPARVAVEAPEFVQTAIAAAFESEKGWRFHEEPKYTQSQNPIALWSLPRMKSIPARIFKQLGIPNPSPPRMLSEVHAFLAVDALRVAWGNTDSHSELESHSSPSFADAETRSAFTQYFRNVHDQPKLALVRIPVDRRSLDGDRLQSSSLPPSIEYVPSPSPEAERLQMITMAVVATGVAIATVAASITSFLKSW